MNNFDILMLGFGIGAFVTIFVWWIVTLHSDYHNIETQMLQEELDRLTYEYIMGSIEMNNNILDAQNKIIDALLDDLDEKGESDESH